MKLFSKSNDGSDEPLINNKDNKKSYQTITKPKDTNNKCVHCKRYEEHQTKLTLSAKDRQF